MQVSLQLPTVSVWSENDSFVFCFFHITDSEESTEAFLNLILCNNSIREMPCVHTAETKAKDHLEFSLDIFHLHFASQNNEWVC